MIVHFYRLDRDGAEHPRALDGELQFRSWQPDRDGLPGTGSRRPVNYLWWVLANAGLFSRRGFSELRIERDGAVVQRLIVTPGWYRFPFMGVDDLQIGDVWTSEKHRRQHLAGAAIAEAHRSLAGGAAAVWYVTEEANEASAALARSCGYRLIAIGRRRRRFGTALLGQYVIDRFL